MKQQNQWQSATCRCCLDADEVDTFHCFECPHPQIQSDKTLVIDRVYEEINKLPCSIELKELILQVFIAPESYSLPNSLRSTYDDLTSIPHRYL